MTYARRRTAIDCNASPTVIRHHTPDRHHAHSDKILKTTDYCRACLRAIMAVETSNTTLNLIIWVRVTTFKEWP